MKTVLLLAALVLIAGACSRAPAEPGPALDGLDRIARVEITGDAAAVHLTARAGGVHEARLTARRSGFFSGWWSSWLGPGCRSGGRLWVEGEVLHVAIAAPGWGDAADCEVELTATLPPDASVAVALPAAELRLAGAFAALDVDAAAADVSLAGSVGRVDLRGAAMRARLDLANGPAPERLRFAVGSLDAAVELPASAPVGWRVEAKASLLDTQRVNAPDAPTRLEVRADFLRFSLR